MGWFEKQVKQRKDLDQQLFEESFFRATEIILGKRAASQMSDDRIITRQAIEDILKYYHYKPVEIPKFVKDHEEQLDYSLRPHGIMRRNIELEEGWYKDSYGPILAYLKEDGSSVALLPKKIVGYYYLDRKTGKNISVGRKNAQLFEREAYCFYRPLPQKKLGISDLLKYMKDCLFVSDIVIMAAATLGGTLIGMILPRITKALTGQVLNSGELSALWGVGICIVCVMLVSLYLTKVR